MCKTKGKHTYIHNHAAEVRTFTTLNSHEDWLFKKAGIFNNVLLYTQQQFRELFIRQLSTIILSTLKLHQRAPA